MWLPFAIVGVGTVATATTIDPSATLLDKGVLGALCVILLGGLTFCVRLLVRAYNREKDRADRMEHKVEELNKAIEDSYVGALGEAVKAVSDALRTVRRSR